MPYATPPADLMPVIDAPPPPAISMAPGGSYLAFVHYTAHPDIAMLARPYLALAGLRIDPQLRARRRLRRAGRLSVLRIADGREEFPGLPEGAQVGFPVWAADGRRFAFTVDGTDGVRLWVADAETGAAAELPGLSVCDVLGGDPPRAAGRCAGPATGGRCWCWPARPAARRCRNRPPSRGWRRPPGSGRSWRPIRTCCGPAPTRTASRRWPPRSRAGWTRPAGRAPSLARPGSTTPCRTPRTGRTCWCSGCGGRSRSGCRGSGSPAAPRSGTPAAGVRRARGAAGQR